MLFALRLRADLDHAVFWHSPAVRTVGGVQDGLKAVILPVLDWLKLVSMAAGALDREAEQAAHHVLQRAFEDGVTVDANFVRVAVALSRAILSIAEKVRCGQKLHHVPRHVPARHVPGDFVSRELLSNE